MSDALRLRATIETAFARDDAFPARFYARLFEAHPELRTMFHRNTPGAQAKMFAQKLTALVDHLDDPAWMGREIPALSASHAGYGVTPAMYPPVGEALIGALRDACGDEWTDDAERAWAEVYVRLTQAILASSP